MVIGCGELGTKLRGGDGRMVSRRGDSTAGEVAASGGESHGSGGQGDWVRGGVECDASGEGKRAALRT